MNYRHAYHAGNFADVMKHGLQMIILRHLLRKPAGFLVLDTHAGCGAYDLNSEEARRTGEWRDGFGRCLDLEVTPAPLHDYLNRLRALGAPARYPGSPLLTASILRPQDHLICCELHPKDSRTLRRQFRDTPQVGVHERDGYTALKAFLPPRSLKRGLTLIDPPFEQGDEFDRLADAIATARGLFPMGIVAAWYPIKHRTPVRAFHDTLRNRGLRDLVNCSLFLRNPTDPSRLNGCGLLVAAPPWQFEEQAVTLLESMLPILAPDGEGSVEIRRIAEE